LIAKEGRNEGSKEGRKKIRIQLYLISNALIVPSKIHRLQEVRSSSTLSTSRDDTNVAMNLVKAREVCRKFDVRMILYPESLNELDCSRNLPKRSAPNPASLFRPFDTSPTKISAIDSNNNRGERMYCEVESATVDSHSSKFHRGSAGLSSQNISISQSLAGNESTPLGNESVTSFRCDKPTNLVTSLIDDQPTRFRESFPGSTNTGIQQFHN